MGLIVEDICVELSGRNIPHYEQLGYKIPKYFNKNNYEYFVKRGTKIVVNVSDLPKGSNVLVNTICDGCGREKAMTYNTYSNNNHDGKTYCQQCYAKLFNSGENCYSWRYDLTEEERNIERNYPEYKNFIKHVLARDNYTCQVCGDENTKRDILVHHLDGYNWCVEKRVSVTNGITLCKTCHSNFHAIYGNGDNTKSQFEEWVGEILNISKKYNYAISPTRKIYCFDNNITYESAYEFAENFNVKSLSQIYLTCNRKNKTCKKMRIQWFDEYLKMSNEDIFNYLNWTIKNESCKKIICLNNKKIFSKVIEAAEYCNTKKIDGIIGCCKGRQSFSGKHPLTKEKLYWMYLDDYNKLSKSKVENIVNESYKEKLKNGF